MVVGGLDPLLLACLGALPEGEPVLGRTRVDVADDQGRNVGTTVLAWVAERASGLVAVRAQLVEATLRLEVLERLVGVGRYPARTLVAGSGALVLASAIQFETSRGSSYQAIATTRADPVVAEIGERSIAVEVSEGGRVLRTSLDIG